MSAATYAITAEAGLVAWLDGQAIPLVAPGDLVNLAALALKAHTEWLARTRPGPLALELAARDEGQ